MRLEIRHDADDERFLRPFAPHGSERVQRQIVRAQDDIRIKLGDVFGEPLLGTAGEFAANAREPLQQFGIIRLGEHHAPQFRRALDELHIAVVVNLPVQW